VPYFRSAVSQPGQLGGDAPCLGRVERGHGRPAAGRDAEPAGDAEADGVADADDLDVVTAGGGDVRGLALVDVSHCDHLVSSWSKPGLHRAL
jgi:hypothetical protein